MEGLLAIGPPGSPLGWGGGQEQKSVLVQRETNAIGVSCLIFLVTVGPFPGGFPTEALIGQVSQTQGFLSLGSIICQPLTLLPSHSPALCAWTGGGALCGPDRKPRLHRVKILGPRLLRFPA